MKTYILLFLLITTYTLIPAQEAAPLVGDRPDITESSSVVPKKSLQIEAGFHYAKDTEQNEKNETITFGTILLRYGLFKNAELRFGTDLSQSKKVYTSSDTSHLGISPLSIGTKIFITEEDRWIPEIAFIASIGIPNTGKKEFQSASLTPSMVLALSNTISEQLSIGYNFGAEWNDFSPNAQGVYSIALGYGPGEKIGLFAEVFGSFGKGLVPNNGFDLGLTYLALPNLQLDIYGGFNFDSPAENFFAGFGFIWRIPR